MSDFQRVVISSEETGPDAPVQDAPPNSPPNSEANAPVQEPNNQPDASQPEGEQTRPEWLPEKFKSAEDLAKAYSELEKKFSQPKKEEAPKPEADKAEEGEPPKLDERVKDEEAPKPESKIDLTPFHNEWAEKGEISEDSFGKLEAMGFPKELVQQYIKGFQATQAQEAQALFGEVGGEQSYREMTEWAAKSLSQDEIKAYDEMVSRGDVAQAKIAIKGLHAQYKAANGSAPKLIGGKASSSSSVSPFRSTTEVVAAMSDPRYKADPAFRRDVESRLAISSVF
ncbi:MAG: hypothetical protein EBU90_27875 [Proteobacteria bacterium]|nr:hypothetical protein [Pseudomonadota bacterium]